MCHLQAAAATCRAPLSTKKINRASPLLRSARRGEASTDRRAFYVGPSVHGEGGEKARRAPPLSRPCPRARAREARFARASKTDNV